MAEVIRDGTGSSFDARVDSDNRLHVDNYSSVHVDGTTPAKANIGGAVTREDEWILKSGTTYLWEIKTVGDNNSIDYNGFWYEHINN